MRELELYKDDLMEKPAVCVVTKIDDFSDDLNCSSITSNNCRSITSNKIYIDGSAY